MSKDTKKKVEEYLAKGGKITKCPSEPTPEKEITMKPNHSGLANIMTLLEGALYYGEHARKKKKRDLSKIDLSTIPENLKKKLGI